MSNYKHYIAFQFLIINNISFYEKYFNTLYCISILIINNISLVKSILIIIAFRFSGIFTHYFLCDLLLI